jgi:hypothetical protein
MNFTDRVIELEDDARKYILSKVQDGGKLELISQEELKDSDSDAVWDLPQTTILNKYDESCTYAIIAIDRKGESLDLYGYCLGDNLGETYIFNPYELTANQICNLADYLK